VEPEGIQVMSVKNMLDLNTLGDNTNDSRGDNCYISEKGIQSLPSKISNLLPYNVRSAGRYLSYFYLGGVTYMVFDNFVIDERGYLVLAYYIDQGDNGFEIENLHYAPKDFFSGSNERDIKTVSYFTKTNKKIILYSKNISKENSKFAEYDLTDNIIAVFNNNILAFQLKEYGNSVFFLKNPIFTSLKDAPTEFESPFGVYEFQSFFFLPKRFLANETVIDRILELDKVVVLNNTGDINSVGHGEWSFYTPAIQTNDMSYAEVTWSGESNRLYLMESTVVLYDKKSGDVRIIFSTNKKNISYFNNNTSEFSFYVNSWFYFRDFNVVNMPPFNNDSAPFIYPTDNGTKVIPDYSVNKMINTPKAFIYYKKSDSFTVYDSQFIDYGLERPDYSIANLSNINDIRTEVNRIMNDSDTLTMASVDGNDRSINANMRYRNIFGVLSFLPIYVINDDADLKGQELTYYTTENIWAQRNRIFSIGINSKISYPFTNDVNISNKDYEVRVNKFNKTFITEGDNFHLNGPIEYGGNKTVNYNVIQNTLFQNGNKAIYHWFEWITRNINEEISQNRLYYSFVGDFYLEAIDSTFIEPSNIADKLIGAWGNDRELYTIGKKSMEQFNISDSSTSPVSFVRVFKTYQKLIDWTAINNNFNILTYENSNFHLNDVSFIRRDLFDVDSRFGVETAIKGMPFTVIDNGAKGKLLIDSEARAFNADNNMFIQAINIFTDGFPIFSNNMDICLVNLENENRFKVGFFYRTDENILLRCLSVNAAAYDRQASEKKKNYKVYRNEKLIFERNSSQQTVNFYSLGRGWNDNLSVECQGYLKSIIVEDTAIGQRK
jgi:hypothetical protein